MGEGGSVRETFSEFYLPGDDELLEIVTKGLIVLDANVLLDLYRHSSETREQLLTTLEDKRVRPRLRLTYQAGLEFHRHRLDVAAAHAKQYTNVAAALDQLEKSPEEVLTALFASLKGLRDQGVRSDVDHAARKALRRTLKKVRGALNAAEAANVLPQEDLRLDDPIRDRIEALFADAEQVPGRPTPAEREASEKAAHDRVVKEKRPPGTADAKKDDGGIGDALIWLEMKDLAIKAALPVLFVSGDNKSDWMEEVAGRKIGPLPILRREFVVETSQAFHKTSWHGFLEYVRRYLEVEVDAKTVELVEADERERRDRERRAAAARAARGGPIVDPTLLLSPALREQLRQVQPKLAVLQNYRESLVNQYSDMIRSTYPQLDQIRLAQEALNSVDLTALRNAQFAAGTTRDGNVDPAQESNLDIDDYPADEDED